MAKVSAVILIYDIRGFTAASKKIATGDLGAFATSAHKTILDLFSARPPTFVKNLGDGHLLIWETTDDPEKDLVNFVVASAKKARTAFPAFVAGQRSEGVKLPKHMGIGVAVGDVSRSDDYYGVAVNLAARLQNLARPEGLAMDATVFGMAGKRDELIRLGFRRTRVRLKGLGSTLVWVDRPFSWERLLITMAKWFGIALMPVIFVLLSDFDRTGFLPTSKWVQNWIDHYDASIFRKRKPEALIRSVADRDRRAIAAALMAAQLPDGRIGTNVKNPTDPDTDPAGVWGSSQAITGLLAMPHLDLETKRKIFSVYADYVFRPDVFIKGYGWMREPNPDVKYTLGEPAFWTVCMFARALSVHGLLNGDAKKLAEERLHLAQEAASRYHPREDSGGWNIFPNQKHLDVHSPYSTTLALLALLETHSAGMPWEGSFEKRDALLKQTATYLMDHFVQSKEGVGWRRTASPAENISEGMTLQIYAELMRASRETGLEVRPEIWQQIPIHLAGMITVDMNKADDAGEYAAPFTSHLGVELPGGESINFLWHSWAVEAAIRWLSSPAATKAPREQLVQVRRVVGHLIVELSDPMRAKAIEGMSYIGGETLLGYSNVPPP